MLAHIEDDGGKFGEFADNDNDSDDPNGGDDHDPGFDPEAIDPLVDMKLV